MASMDKDIRETEMDSISVMQSPVADRNKEAILQSLKQILPEERLFALEVASGTGQHVAYFAPRLPQVTWQPSDCDKKSMLSIQGYIQATGAKNILQPSWIDTTLPEAEWANGSLSPMSCDLILCVNMIHIAEWNAARGLFQGSGYYLKPGGLLITYGPYAIHGKITPDSNVQFDRMLRQQNSDWGLRDTDELETLAAAQNMVLEKMIDMPTNNKTLVFRKSS